MTKSKTEDLSFEAALAELEKIVRQLETGASDLSTSIEAYERGMTLKKLCETKLKEAQGRIEKITLAADGTPKAEAFSLGDAG